jgi:hypothetical protein
MLDPTTASLKSALPPGRWSLRDSVAAAVIFAASAAVVLAQNAHLAILWDASYTLDTSFRIALGQMPYRDFPLAHAPLTFLIQAAIIRLAGRVFYHHVLYAAIVGGLGTVLAWRIVLDTLRGRLRASWLVSLLLAAPLTFVGIYSILPFPSYDCDTAFSILLAVFLLQRVPADFAAPQSRSAGALARPFIAGAALALPLFGKQNIGLPLLLAAFALILLLLALKLTGSPSSQRSSETAILSAILFGAVATILLAGLLLHFTAGVGNYIHWTIQFAAERRLPGLQPMLAVYAEPALLWQLPTVAAALALLLSPLAKSLWARLVALGLLGSPFAWTLASLFLSSDAEDRAGSLLALWPLLLVLSCVLTLWNLRRDRSLRALLPVIVLVAIQGTFLSQQLWGSTYAIWPLLVILIAEMIAWLASMDAAGTAARDAHRRLFVAPALAAVISVTLAICGGLYTASEERLNYAKLDGEVQHSAVPALRGLAVAGPYLPELDELLRFAANEIPVSDGLILIPGEDPFYYATGRVPQFPVLLFDNATDPFSPAQLVEEARRRNIRWLIVKRNLQINEDVTPQREATLVVLQQVFLPFRKLGSYDVYRRP